MYFELKFEWDEEKDRTNQIKHGISFEAARWVFLDEYRIISARKADAKERRRYYDRKVNFEF